MLLHPLDFLGGDDVQALSFFPAMRVPSGPKLELVSEALRMLAKHYEIVPMQRHAAEVANVANLPTRAPNFESQPVRLALS